MFFAEFLAATGVFERWVSGCPLAYRSDNAPDKRDVLGTLMLGLLASHRRYAHITALRGDAVAAQALGMNKIVSEDALRRALERIDESQSSAWLRRALMHSVREALDRPWVLDIDASKAPRSATTRASSTPAATPRPRWGDCSMNSAMNAWARAQLRRTRPPGRRHHRVPQGTVEHRRYLRLDS